MNIILLYYYLIYINNKNKGMNIIMIDNIELLVFKV